MSPKRRSFLLLIFTRLSFTAFTYKNFGGELYSALNKRKTALQHDWLEITPNIEKMAVYEK